MIDNRIRNLQGFNQKLLILISSVALALACFWFFGWKMQLVSLLIGTAIAYILFLNTLKSWERRSTILGMILGGALSLCMVVGRKIVFPNKEFLPFSILDIGWFLVLTVVFFILAMNLKLLADKADIQCFAEAHPEGRKAIVIWGIGTVILLLCWLPTFLTYYPGCLTSDSLSSVYQAMGDAPLSNHHPILFTMLVKIFVMIGNAAGSISVGVGLFSLVQMSIMAGILSYGLLWLLRYKIPKLLVVFIGLYFVLSQVFPLYAISMWKDVLFSGVLFLLVLFLYDIWSSRGERLNSGKGLVYFLVLCILACFLRNNGLYVICGLLVIVAVYYRRMIKRLLPAFAAVMAFVLLIQGPVFNALGIQKSSFEEAAGIPLQQIARTVAMDGQMTEEQKAYLDQVMPLDRIKSQYDPYTSNLIKFDDSFDSDYFNQTKGEFMKVWAQMLFPNFKHYVKAYLMETQGYWHPTTKDWIVSMPEYFGNPHGITSTDWVQVMTGKSLKGPIEKMADFLSIGTLFWLTAFCVGVTVLKREKGKWLFSLPLFLLWATNMIAAPAYCEFRYMFSFALALPFVIVIMMLRDPTQTEQSSLQQ